MQSETLEIDEVVYDFPGRMVQLRRDGSVVKEFETWGLEPFEVADAEVDLEEKFVYVRGDLEVEISWRGATYEGESYREGERIESIESVPDDPGDERLATVLEKLHDDLEDLDVPAEYLEIRGVTRSDDPDCTCGVCGSEVTFGKSNIVDPDEFDYDDWETQALHEYREPLDQERICLDCERKFIENGGEFPLKFWPGYEECDNCHGMGRVPKDPDAEVYDWEDCDACGADGVIEVA